MRSPEALTVADPPSSLHDRAPKHPAPAPPLSLDTTPSSRPRDFAADFESTVQGLCGALTEALAAVGADPGAPQAMSRRYGINRNLAWKLSKIVHARDAYAAVRHLPGTAGVGILLEALAKAGAGEAEIARLRDAFAAFEEMVVVHAGDRATLDLMLSSRVASDDDPGAEASRKLAFQGNSAIWGIHAKLRFGAQIVALNPEHPELIDVISFGGYQGFRRLRADAEWPLVFKVAISSDGSTNEAAWEPLDPSAGDGPPLMHDFCSAELPDLRPVDVPHGTSYLLPPGGVGNTAAFDCTFGWLTRACNPIHRTDGNDKGAHSYPLNAPAELAQFDLLLHRDIPVTEKPELVVYSRLEEGMGIPAPQSPKYHLTVREGLQDLGDPAVVATPHLPRYSRMMQAATERAGWDLREFRGYRFTLRYPPIPTVPTLSYPLP